MSNYLVDTSVWIDFFKNNQTPAVEKSHQLLDNKENYGITELIYQEVLQGALHEKDFANLADYLTSQTFFYPKSQLETYKQAAYLYFSCRRQGITVRSTIDCMIAQIAIIDNQVCIIDSP